MTHWIAILIVSLVLVFGGFTALLWKIGMFDFTGTDASAKIVASSLALVGALFGSLVTIAGVFLKYSLDGRNATLREQAEKRLKLEAAIQAVQLLGSSSDAEAPRTQRAGVIFALASLGMLELALTMARHMMSTERSDAFTVNWLIDSIFKSNDERLQREAVVLLADYIEEFLADKGQSAFPTSLELTWNTQLPEPVRELAAHALLRMIVARPFAEWNEQVLSTHFVTMVAIWRTESLQKVRNGVGLCLQKIIDIYSEKWVLYPPTGPISTDKLRKELAERLPSDVVTFHHFRELAKHFEQWMQEAKKSEPAGQ